MGWWKISWQLEHNGSAPAFSSAPVSKWLVGRNGCGVLQSPCIHAEPGTAGLHRLGLRKEERRGLLGNQQRWGHPRSLSSCDLGAPPVSSLTFVSLPFLRTVTELLINETNCLGLVSLKLREKPLGRYWLHALCYSPFWNAWASIRFWMLWTPAL